MLSVLPLSDSKEPDLTWDKSYKTLPTEVLVETPLVDLGNVMVYRYCSFPEALALFTRGEWTFSHPSTWSDKYEKGISTTLFGEGTCFSYVAPHVKCLTLEHTSNAIWKLYGGPVGLLRLGIKMNKLIQMLGKSSSAPESKLHLVRVRYLRQKDFNGAVDRLKKKKLPKEAARYAVPALAIKRDGFKYENEIRVCAMSSAKGLHLTLTNLDVTAFTTILIDPYMDAWQAKELKFLIKDNLAVRARVDQSKFDADASFLQTV